MKKIYYLLAFICSLSLFVACSDDDDSTTSPETTPEETTPSEPETNLGDSTYILAATSDEATYLLNSANLADDSLSIKNNGFETDNGTEWIFYKNKTIFRLVYNQGNAGQSSSYQVNNTTGAVEATGYTYTMNRFTTYGTFGDYVLTAASASLDEKDANGNAPYGISFNLINATDHTVTSESINAENLLGNGEYVSFSGLLEANGKLYTGVIPMGVSAYGVDQGWATEARTSTNYYDSVWVAVYDGVDFKNPTIIKDNRLSYASSRFRSQYYTNLCADNSGNVYVFSSSYDSRTTKKSGVLKINKGATSFDSSFYIDIETASGGYHMFKPWYVGGNYFVLQMYSSTGAATSTGSTLKLGVLDISTKKFTFITGLPEESTISAIGKAPLVENGKLYVSITPTVGFPRLYTIYPSTASATAGTIVNSTGVVALGKMYYNN